MRDFREGPAVLSQREMAKLLATAGDLRTRLGRRDRALVGVLSAGLRVSEAVSLTVDSVERSTRRQTVAVFPHDQKTKSFSPSPTYARGIEITARLAIVQLSKRFGYFLDDQGICLRMLQVLRVCAYLKKIGRADLHTHPYGIAP